MTYHDQSLFNSTSLSTLLSASSAPALTAPGAEEAPGLDYAYDYYTGKQVESTVQLRSPGADPEFQRQWHLKQLGNIGKVWQEFTGKDVSVGVYDSGVQRAHWDLAANYDVSKHLVINGQVLDGEPVANPADLSAPHGTSVAGLIAAARNGRGGVGIAFDAQVTGVNAFDSGSPIFINRPGSKFTEALMQSSKFDVTNHSYGIGWSFFSGTVASRYDRAVQGSLVYADTLAHGYAAEVGRDGLGTISVSAAGNFGIDGQYDGVKTSRHTIAVSAYRQVDGNKAFYSSYGPHVLVAAPSNDHAMLGGTGLVTTDLLGARGYNWSVDPAAANDYTDGFGGTSGAAPIVSGVVSLMLDANADLGWRDVRSILAASAKMPVAFDTGPTLMLVETANGLAAARLNGARFRLAGEQADWNGGRMHFSNDYGYGAVDAYNAVRMAEVWSLFGAAKTTANEAHVSITRDVGITAEGTNTVNDPNFVIKYGDDFTGSPIEYKFDMASGIDIEHIDLQIKFSNFVLQNGTKLPVGLTYDQFKLVAPDGTVGYTSQYGFSLFLGANPNESMTFGFSGFQGVESAGTWTLQWNPVNIINADLSYLQKSLTIHSLKMDVYGSEATNDDVFTYTNEFFTMAAIDGEGDRRSLVDVDGGTDWINAAAVSSDIKLSLVSGQATTFGGQRAFTLGRTSVIEGAVTGDGNDTLTGSRFDNYLYGMRGNDTLNGGAGADFLFGGTGSDKFLFDNRGASGKDTVLDWSRGDMIATQTALRGQSAEGRVTVANNAMLLLDGQLTGDTVLLSQNGGAVLQSQGQKDGYFWYSYLSGADLDPNDVIREVSFQPERTAAGAVEAITAASIAASADGGEVALGFSPTGAPQDVFFLYDAMAGSMVNGVLLHA